VTGSFRILEDIAVADVAFEAQGDSPAELFRAAGRALIEIMADPQTVGRSWTRRIVQRETDLAALLFDWLSELVYWKDAAGVVYSELELELTEHEGRYEVVTTLVGEAVDPGRHELRADVKAVTKHLYEVGQRDGRWSARVVLDV
jgi:SHS2 domain-containing protein